jgi:hypothetical protein
MRRVNSLNFIKQCCISQSLEGLEDDIMRKYNLTERNNVNNPCVFFGMYREEDIQALIGHKGICFVVWMGSDAKDLPEEWIEELSKHINISISIHVQNSLENKSIKSFYLPLNATIAEDWPLAPKGDSIYWYYNEDCKEFYGSELIDQIEQRINIPIIKADYKTFTREELYDVYSQCFINLRLTPHDGCPNTNLQMGLMGRKSIYNGDLAHSIKWENVDDICESIMNEYNNRHLTDSVSKDFYNFVKILTK